MTINLKSIVSSLSKKRYKRSVGTQCLLGVTCLIVVVINWLFFSSSLLEIFRPNGRPTSLVSLRRDKGRFTTPLSWELKFERERRRINLRDIHPSIADHRLEKNLKNPCWFENEERSSLYENNPYAKYSESLKENFEKFERLERDDLFLRGRRFRCMPYFYIFGVQKSGTTDFYEKLTSHPQIETGPLKEPDWWIRRRFGLLNPEVFFHQQRYSRSFPPATFRDYLDLYDGVAMKILRSIGDPAIESDGRFKVIVDASVCLMWDSDGWLKFLNWRSSDGSSLPSLIASQLFDLNPSAKLIAVLRDPASRLYSEYRFRRDCRGEKSPQNFHELVVSAIETFDSCLSNATLESCSHERELNSFEGDCLEIPFRLRAGLYHVFLRDWLRHFSPRQILLLRMEDYVRDIPAALEEARGFLGLDLAFRAGDEKLKGIRNRGRVDVGRMKTETAELLRNFYEPHNRELAKLWQDERFLWRDFGTTPS